MELFREIRAERLPCRPLYTSQAVLSEFATLALYKLGHETATTALAAIREPESITVVSVSTATFETAAVRCGAYDDQQISFVDHTTSVLAADRDIDHVVAFDSDVRTLGVSLVPADAALPD